MDSDSDCEVPSLVPIPAPPTSTDSHFFEKKVPITILCGFLGSGKTTLLNHILTSFHGKRIAVVENEFSAGLGIEGMIARNGLDGSNITDFFELNNGCVSYNEQWLLFVHSHSLKTSFNCADMLLK